MIAVRAAILAAATALAPVTAMAQADAYSKVSFSASQMYDANLFATPRALQPRADLITRFGPTFEAGYRFLPIELDARYALQAERYVDHPELDDNLARHDATIGARYLPNDRFRVSMNAQLVRTQNPSELNSLSQLSVGRAPAQRLAFAAAAAYNVSDAASVSAGHAFGRDALAGGLTSTTNSLQIGLRRRTSDRSSYRLDYDLRRVDFDGGSPIVSHVLTAGRSYSITPRTGFEIAAGPRLTGGVVRPEIMAALRRQVSWGELSLAFSRTEVTAIGEQGTIDVHRIAATGRYRATRRLMLTGTPSITHNAQGGRRAPVYLLDVESALEVNRRLSVVASGRIGRQDGTLSGPRDIIPAGSFAVQLLITLPRSAGGDAPGRSPS